MIRPWFETPINFEKIKNTTKNFIAIFSDDDEYVPPENQTTYKKELGAKIIVEHNKGHFGGDSGIKELPSALDAVLGIAEGKQ
ncbi:MAG: alpha/beta hydrolase [Bacteroidetes bacterium]|nr:alpha/beta hydrolase [Bacteroidota bacterium]